MDNDGNEHYFLFLSGPKKFKRLPRCGGFPVLALVVREEFVSLIFKLTCTGFSPVSFFFVSAFFLPLDFFASPGTASSSLTDS